LASLIVEHPSEEKVPVGKSKRGVGGLELKFSPAFTPKYQILAYPCANVGAQKRIKI
jgi:hypothetical protein